MYDLNYTYLTELEVDTRQTFSDLEDDLLLVHKNDVMSTTFNMRTLITCWQNFFWNAGEYDNLNSIKAGLDVTFTDLIIKHTGPLSDNEMMSIKEFDDLWDSFSGKKQWSGKRTFTELSAAIINKINSIHAGLTNDKKVYPVGSIHIGSSKPNFGGWVTQNYTYLGESGIPGTKIGYTDGNAKGKNVGTDLASLVITPETNGKSPAHTHKCHFVPEADGGSDAITSSTSSESVTFKTELHPGSDAGNDTGKRKAPVCSVSNDANGSGKSEGEGAPTFECKTTEVKPGITEIRVAPKTYPLNASLWERMS